MLVALAALIGAAALIAGVWKLPCRVGEKILMAALGFWTACIVAANVLSPFGQLGSRPAYAAALALACAAAAGAFRCWRNCPRSDFPPSGPLGFAPANPLLRRAGFAVALALLGVLLVSNLWLALAISPTNPDSQMYRLPRIYFYESQGSLLHFARGIDGRMLFYPFNGALLLMPVALGGWPVEMLTVASVLTWAAAGLLVYEFCRSLGCGAFVAVWTVVLVVSAPILLAMATSTNDEILAGTALLGAVFFFWRYVQSRALPMLLLSGLWAGCSFGTKLQFLYLWPVGLLLGAVLLLRGARAGRRGVLDVLRAGAIWATPAVLLGAPFLVYSYVSTGHLFDPVLAGLASNTPFDLRLGIQNWLLHSAELLASPFFEFFRWMTPDAQAALLAHVNERFVEIVSPWLSLEERFFLPGEAVRGIWGTANVRPNENTEWIGLLWLAFAFCFVIALRRRRALSELFLWLPAAAALWWFSFCLSVRFFGPMGVHFGYAAVVCGPVLCLLFVPLASAWARIARGAIVVLCLAVNLVAAAALFTTNQYRSFARDEAPRREGRDHLHRELAGFDDIRILITHYAVPYLEVIRAFPSKKFRVVVDPEANPDPDDETVELYCMQRGALRGKEPVKIPPAADALRLLGEIAPMTRGTEFIFGRGVRREDAQSYAVLEADVAIETEMCRIAFTGRIWPPLREPLEYRISFSRGGKSLSAHDWAARPQFEEIFTGKGVRQIEMKVEARRVGEDASTVTSTLTPFRLKGPDLWPGRSPAPAR